MGSGGRGGGLYSETDRKQSLKIGTDHSSVYDNENEGGWGEGCYELILIRTDWNGLLVLEIRRSDHNSEGRGFLGGCKSASEGK